MKPKMILFSLCNPPIKEFVHTRHNIGRLFVDQYLAKKLTCKMTRTAKYIQYEFN